MMMMMMITAFGATNVLAATTKIRSGGEKYKNLLTLETLRLHAQLLVPSSTPLSHGVLI